MSTKVSLKYQHDEVSGTEPSVVDVPDQCGPLVDGIYTLTKRLANNVR